MSVVIRLSRQGRKHLPIYRIAVADSRNKPQGKFLQHIGHYDPNQNPPVLKVDEPAAIKWMQTGAKPSETVHTLFRRAGLMDKFIQVKAGKTLEEAAGAVRTWKPRTKLHKKAKEAQAKEREEAEKAEVAKAAEATKAAAAKVEADKAEAAAKAAEAEKPAEATPEA